VSMALLRIMLTMNPEKRLDVLAFRSSRSSGPI
jgi:hypothetical protein